MQKNVPIEILITVPFNQILIDQLQDISPKLRLTIMPTDKDDEISHDQWLKTEVLYTESILPDDKQAPNLHWIQLHHASGDIILRSSLLEKPDIVITTMSGAAVSKIAEYTIMMMLAMGHNLTDMLECQKNGEFPENSLEGFIPKRELWGSTVGIVGYGSIGREIARLLYPFGVTILATKRDAMNPKDTGYVMEGHGDPDGNLFHRLYPIQALHSMLKECDFIILTLPYSEYTQNIFSEEEFSVLKPSAYLINVSSRGVVSEEALIKSLVDNRLAGAVMDVKHDELMLPENPLWTTPNLILTPHIAGASINYDGWAMMLFIENIKRYLSGGVLLNRFDTQKSY